MGNPYRGDVTLKALGREQILRFGNQELAQLEEALGFKGLGGLLSALGNVGFKERREYLRIGLTKHWPGGPEADPGLDDATIDEIIDELGNNGVLKILREAFKRAFPEVEWEEDEEGKKVPKGKAKAKAKPGA